MQYKPTVRRHSCSRMWETVNVSGFSQTGRRRSSRGWFKTAFEMTVIMNGWCDVISRCRCRRQASVLVIEACHCTRRWSSSLQLLLERSKQWQNRCTAVQPVWMGLRGTVTSTSGSCLWGSADLSRVGQPKKEINSNIALKWNRR
jgi:hypothetical protein